MGAADGGDLSYFVCGEWWVLFPPAAWNYYYLLTVRLDLILNALFICKVV